MREKVRKLVEYVRALSLSESDSDTDMSSQSSISSDSDIDFEVFNITRPYLNKSYLYPDTKGIVLFEQNLLSFKKKNKINFNKKTPSKNKFAKGLL
jgi:hypothetical protein